MIKISAADKWFSRCVRARNEWKCERCGKWYGPSSSALHNSHYHGRSNKSVRWDKDNGFACCFGCHRWLGSNPAEHTDFVRGKLGDTRFELLKERKSSIVLGKQLVKDEKHGLIAHHYRQQFKEIQQKRADGVVGYLDFMVY